jgi:hypothetical protein
MNLTDKWGQCIPGDLSNRCPIGPYLDNQPKYFGDVLINEPCNYVSNIAYYRAATRICDNENWNIDDEKTNAVK